MRDAEEKYEKHARLGMRTVYFALAAIGLMVVILVMLLYPKEPPALPSSVNLPDAQSQPKINYKSNAPGVDGEKLFKQNCAVCHSLGENVISGPGLAGVMGRVPSRDWMKSWIKNADKMKKTDAYAQEIDKKFPGTNMTPFEFLSDEEIEEIIRYIEAATGK